MGTTEPRVNITRDIRYGTASTQGGESIGLLLDFYALNEESTADRPLIILAHGGGFAVGERDDMELMAVYFAEAGYAVASISYRLMDVPDTDENLKRAVIDALLDMKAAVRFFRSRAGEFRIDESFVVVGGYSAGAVTALHYGYLSDLDEVEAIGGTALRSYVEQNGGLEGNSGNAGFSSAINGIVNLAGALAGPDLIDAGEPFLYSAHGTDDPVVPYGEGRYDDRLPLYGSGYLHPLLDAAGISNELLSVEGGNHAVFYQCGCYQAIVNYLDSQR